MRALGGRSSLLGLVDQTASGVGGDGALAQPVFGASEVEDERLALGLGSVGAEELDRRTITAGTGLSHDNVVDGFMDGADARETDFESHVKWFSSGYVFGKAEEFTGAPHPCQEPTWGFVAGLTGFAGAANVRALCSKQASSASPM